MSDSAPPSSSESPEPSGSPDPQELRRALKAFKKRLKLTRLDDESRLGVGPMSSGAKGGIVAIIPPAQYPRSVWEALADQGKLRRAGHGLYELVKT